MSADKPFSTEDFGSKSGSGYPGKAESDSNGTQSGDKVGSLDGAGKTVGKEQGFAKD